MKSRGLGEWMEGEKDPDFGKLWSVSGLLELDMSQRETEHSGIPSEQDEAHWASRGTGPVRWMGPEVPRRLAGVGMTMRVPTPVPAPSVDMGVTGRCTNSTYDEGDDWVCVR